MYKIPNFVKVSKDSVLYNDSGTFNLYVPERYFELSAAKYAGNYIELLGICNYAIEKNGKMGELHEFYIPTVFTTKPHYVEKLKDIHLTKDSPKEDYRVLKYIKDDPIIVSTRVPQDISFVELLLKMFIITGDIPNTIPYDKIQNMIIDNMDINGNDYKVTLQLWGFIISEICRSKSNPEIPYRLSKSNNLHDYKSISIKEVSRMDSPYSAINTENFDVSAVKATLTDKESTSPLEKIMTGDFG